jgi:seryl-tRNA synthetase
LKNEAVRIRYALIQMFTDKLTDQGFELVSPPYLTKDLTLYASGYLPFAQKDNFKIVNEDLSLIGTSEQSLLGIHLDEILVKLPLLYLGDSMCFRTEAGSYGRDTAGILRVHQFYKLEQIVYCHPDESEAWHLKCLENEEWLMQELEIPYQVVLTASQDLAAPGRMKYDTEAWIPSQGKYRETTSNTNMDDYQTRRGNIRFKIGKEKGFPHTISATGFCDRLIIAIMENYQEADGSIVIPQKLVPYMGGLSVIQPKQIKL